jgi:hypothetical protein
MYFASARGDSLTNDDVIALCTPAVFIASASASSVGERKPFFFVFLLGCLNLCKQANRGNSARSALAGQGAAAVAAARFALLCQCSPPTTTAIAAHLVFNQPKFLPIATVGPRPSQVVRSTALGVLFPELAHLVFKWT